MLTCWCMLSAYFPSAFAVGNSNQFCSRPASNPRVRGASDHRTRGRQNTGSLRTDRFKRQSRAGRFSRSARHGTSLHLDHDRPRLLPIPRSHLATTGRMMAMQFGVRSSGLGVRDAKCGRRSVLLCFLRTPNSKPRTPNPEPFT